ncbi:MAG: peptidoglycan DD-metalloendopeptidase family protein [Patescibacteria group bacterium]|nr:peptidoglycan DD-metalloendopeptidase family protein [Patescibacteria group bacterium]
MGNKQADAGVSPVSADALGVLQANVGPADVTNRTSGDIAMVDNTALVQESGVDGTQADIPANQSTQISLYVVRQGDTLSQIAEMFNVSVNTIIWANDIKGPIHAGDELVILPIDGVSHKVVKGDTIDSIAKEFKADSGDIMSYNSLQSNADLTVGSTIIIPDGEAALPATTVTSSGGHSHVSGQATNPTEKLRGAWGIPDYPGYYERPIDGGVKTQGLHGYNAVDLADPIGTPIHAAADGVVIIAREGGWNGGYGSYVVISHPNGTQTLYAHMSKVIAVQGEDVAQGETIGLIGMTGKTTGPHVHFEVRGAVNPF